MSAFAGILHFDGKPADRKRMAEFGNALSVYNPDGGGEVFGDSVGMIYRGFHTNRHSFNEIQPHTSQSGTIISWDGRLDNRKELSAICEVKEVELTDVQIVSACYELVGVRCLKSLVGDFALALWDAASR